MSGLNSVFNIGRNGLLAAQDGTAVTSQNLTNAATEGYSRRLMKLDPIPLSQGGGVRSNGGTRVQDQFLERRSLAARSQSGEAEGRVQTLQILDSVLADDQGGVGAALDAFESALSDLSAQPSDPGTRQALLNSADQLGQAFNRAANTLSDARAGANQNISSSIDRVNQKLDAIGALSVDITRTRNAGQEPSDLLDQRDQLVREIARDLPVTTLTDARGNFSLLLAGSRTLVDSTGGPHHLQTGVDATTGDVSVLGRSAGALQDVTALITSGTIGGTIAARDGALRTAQNGLDQLAFDVATAYNAQHSQGFGLDGLTGRNLFATTDSAAGAASNLTISDDVAGAPGTLAAAQTAASLPGDNRNALRLLGVQDLHIANGGKASAQSAFSSIIAGAGSAVRTSMDRQNQAEATLDQMNALRESVSGVSSDDEMISLMRYQRAYQASLRVIETADQMMQQLLALRS